MVACSEQITLIVCTGAHVFSVSHPVLGDLILSYAISSLPLSSCALFLDGERSGRRRVMIKDVTETLKSGSAD